MSNTPWNQRANDLGHPDGWQDDLDIHDADERQRARTRVLDAPGTLSHAGAVEVVNTQRRTWVNPYDALLDEVRRTAAFVALLEREVREFDAQGGAHHSRPGQRVLSRYERERDRLITVSKTAISLGIAERTVQLVESQAREFAVLVSDAAQRAGLSSEQRQSLLSEIAAGYRARATTKRIEAQAVQANLAGV